jgi:DNA-binding MarR family transcriptional regulator
MGLSVAGFRLIGEVSAAPDGLRQSELAARLGVRPPTVSVAVKRLEELGLVTRVPDPSDPRARLVRVNPKANLGPGRDLIQLLDQELTAGLDSDGVQALDDSLMHLQERLAGSTQ